MKRLPAAKILILEDEPLVLLDVEDALAEAGARNLFPFSSLEDAMLFLENETPDAAIVDLMIRGLPSRELIAVLKERDVPILLHSALAPDAENDAEAIFMNLPWLGKPAEPVALAAALQKAYEMKHPRK